MTVREWGSERAVNAAPDGAQGAAALAALDGGGWVSAWLDDSTGLRLRRFDGAGVALGPETGLALSVAATGPALAALPGGGFSLSFLARVLQPGNPYDIGLATFDASGALVAPPAPITDFYPVDETAPAAAALPGGAVVVWSFDSAGLLKRALVDAAGGAALGPLYATSGDDTADPAVAALAGGATYAAAWVEDDRRIQAMVRDEATGTIVAFFRVAVAPDGTELRATAVAGLADGGLVVT